MPSIFKVYRHTCAGCGTPRGSVHDDGCRFRGGAAANRKPHPPKACAQCGKLFGENLPPSILVDRKTCSQECAKAFRRARRRSALPRSRACAVCNTSFDAGRSDRRTCSTACAYAMRHWYDDKRIVKTPSKQCAVCGKEFSRRETGPGRISAGSFQKRVVCSIKCAGRYVGDKRMAPTPGAKSCKVCGQRFRKRDDEPPHRFRERKTCSQACAKCFLRRLWSVHGVSMTIREIKNMLGVSEVTARKWLSRSES